MPNIHPQAIVEEGAHLEEGVVVEPFAVVKGKVHLKRGVCIKSHAYIDGNTTLGENTIVYPGASIGTQTQDRKYAGETTYVEIGPNCVIREFATINASCGEGSRVTVGEDCLIMAYCHIAHNCEVGSHVIMANGVALAGHVVVEDYVNLGGMTPVHQWVRIGAHSMVGGLSRVTHDIPPYTVGGGIPYKFGGLNIVGLKRREFPFETRKQLARAFNLVYRSGLHLQEALRQIEAEVEPLPEVRHWVEFCRTSKRGLLGLQGVAGEEAQFDEKQIASA
ncbi:MAG: acyl-ACP--UDP-N-acetylglucosamine O-acyltransferase [Parachlamydiales bacterium]